MINNPQKFLEGVWDWDFLSEVLPNNIKISDIDGVLERKGWNLVIETKAHKDVQIPRGQYILYENLVKSGIFTVLFLYGESGNPTHMQLMCPKEWGKPSKIITMSQKVACTKKGIQNLVKRWYRKADSRKVNINQNIQF